MEQRWFDGTRPEQKLKDAMQRSEMLRMFQKYSTFSVAIAILHHLQFLIVH